MRLDGPKPEAYAERVWGSARRLDELPMSKNLLERLKDLTQKLVEATHDGDQQLIEDLQDEIWELEDQIEDSAKDEYDDNHYKSWN